MADDLKKSGSGNRGGDKKRANSGGGGGGAGESFVYLAIAASVIFAALFLLYQPQFKNANIFGQSEIINNPVWAELTQIIRIGWKSIVVPTIILLNVLFATLFIYSIIRVWPLKPTLLLYERGKKMGVKRSVKSKDLSERWQKIDERLKRKTSDDLRLAVIEGDAIIDDFLRNAGYAGENMADRLSQIIPTELKSLERVWRGHRLKNKYVQEPLTNINPREAEEAIDAFRDFLVELEVL